MTFALYGNGVSRGVTIGRVLCIDDAHDDITHSPVSSAERGAEAERLRSAFETVREDFQHLRLHVPSKAPNELRAILEVHMMLLDDPALIDAAVGLIETRGMNAEWALVETADLLAEQFDRMDDPYLRERKHDVLQVVARVRKALAGHRRITAPPLDDLPPIVIARDVAPADMIEYRHMAEGAQKAAGFITEAGGQTSHTAILARSMGVPAVVGVRGALDRLVDGDLIVIDGEQGVIVVQPDRQVLDWYRARVLRQSDEKAALGALRSRACVTIDGRLIELHANIELPEDAIAAINVNASGVGLFRSEFLFLDRDELPDEDEQFDAYRRAVSAMGGRPVTIRTIDIGADKMLRVPDKRMDGTENPALGLRAIRYSLAEPKMFRAQLRAILRAAVYGPVRILLPMISSVREVEAAREQIVRARAELTQRGQPVPDDVPVGGMIEIPAAAVALRAFTPVLDFLSIGTNDLIQYTLAIDRADATVADYYDPLHPAVLALIARTIEEGERAGVSVSVCGEMAGDPLLAPLLLGMGLRNFSMHPAQIPYVKQALLACRHDEARQLADAVLAENDSRVIRSLLAAARPAALRAAA
ncbi:phosphoenolpyruvate--protein phosphotransferase [Derxia gummosa]|uniref:Phosphoenolpyruvate-protein phosphotransferase n=1 Tax=Derxia gummosa DSM 723 TaxID=1121388 RepID=A0A8B6X9K8_9BURK|nr:phosphoenolpyruvate--protein phosphotransferase [Derxia gummosa]